MEHLISKYPKLVQQEARNIVKNIPKEIRDKLNFEDFKPVSLCECVYGQMFGDCYSEEAFDAMKICSPINCNKYSSLNLFGTFTQNIRRKTATPIEVAIGLEKYEKYNEQLIEYLKQ